MRRETSLTARAFPGAARPGLASLPQQQGVLSRQFTLFNLTASPARVGSTSTTTPESFLGSVPLPLQNEVQEKLSAAVAERAPAYLSFYQDTIALKDVGVAWVPEPPGLSDGFQVSFKLSNTGPLELIKHYTVSMIDDLLNIPLQHVLESTARNMGLPFILTSVTDEEAVESAMNFRRSVRFCRKRCGGHNCR